MRSDELRSVFQVKRLLAPCSPTALNPFIPYSLQPTTLTTVTLWSTIRNPMTLLSNRLGLRHITRIPAALSPTTF